MELLGQLARSLGLATSKQEMPMPNSLAIRLSLLITLLTSFGSLVFLPTQAVAQDVASLTGVVTDGTGAVVADVGVKLVDTKTDASYATKTNAVGAYTFTNVPAGPGYK